MTAPERFADSQIPLAPRAPSIHDPLRKWRVHRNNPDNDGFQLVFGAPRQPQSLAGQEHGRTIPLSDKTNFLMYQQALAQTP